VKRNFVDLNEDLNFESEYSKRSKVNEGGETDRMKDTTSKFTEEDLRLNIDNYNQMFEDHIKDVELHTCSSDE
jgi:hypothetical protein